ncbi:MAG: betaine--homocysteine S-methyltransferase [Ilumatobacteraceae bacterium]|nr:betaine--homocysteine S-methyltransferase [Ilumatobacteraceae bacterium]
MRASLAELLSSGRTLLADGATGTNYFERGLGAGDPPEFWNVDHPDKVRTLHQQFVDAGADIILTNTFGCNRHRLKLHKAEGRVYELAKRAAEIACEVADASPRPIVVAGSVGPTGELFEPLGALTERSAIESFGELAQGLKDGGADIAWIETMSAAQEIRAAATGALQAGLPYTATCSFDTAGRTMMGLLPGDLSHVFDGLAVPPVAIGANCGVGASDILVSLLAMTERDVHTYLISKGNCGVPHFAGTEAVYSGTPELMAKYTQLAVKAGARVVGGCCGTSPVHLAAMRRSLDELIAKPTIDDIIQAVGPLVNSAPSGNAPDRERRRGRRGE